MFVLHHRALGSPGRDCELDVCFSHFNVYTGDSGAGTTFDKYKYKTQTIRECQCIRNEHDPMIQDMALIVSQTMIANKKVDDGVALPASTTDPLRPPPARRPLPRRPLLHPGSRHLKHAGASINMREQVAMAMMITLEPAGFSYSR